MRARTIAILSAGLALAALAATPTWDVRLTPTPGPWFAVVPHHDLTSQAVGEFYAQLALRHPDVDRVVIVSPNHFGGGSQFLESVPRDGTACFLSGCVRMEKPSWFSPSPSPFPIFWDTVKADLATREHGIGIHFKYVARHFGAGVTVVPLVVRRELDGFARTDAIEEEVASLLGPRTLVLASVDFSHHVDERFARFHDAASVAALETGTGFSTAEVDCRNCLALVTDLARAAGKSFFEPAGRTSVDTVLGVDSGTGNTSHVLGEFFAHPHPIPQIGTPWPKFKSVDDYAVYGAFFGDAAFPRKMADRAENDPSYYGQVLREFSQLDDPSMSGASFYHQKLTGFDFVGANLETAVGVSGSCVAAKPADLTLVTPPEALQKLRRAGFTAFGLANNHALDCGPQGYAATLAALRQNGLDSFGTGDILTGSSRGLAWAVLGANDFDPGMDYGALRAKITELKKSGSRVVVSAHWGEEYSTTPTDRQRALGRSFVDAGADLVVGSHPHVVQPVETYRGVPIVYSLGNFVFDQPQPETLTGAALLFSMGNSGTRWRVVPFRRDPKDYSIHFLPDDHARPTPQP